jgi:filamentous hemagglutinin family protein
MPVDLRVRNKRFPYRRPFCRLIAATLAISIALAPLQSGALAAELPMPTGNWLGSGQATHAYSGNTLTINQTSNRAILNWQSFNIGRDGAVRFNQPGSSAAALNRIFDANPSVIQGQLTANGQIYLINQSGIIFGQGAQVNVGALVASTLDITDELFERGLLSADGSAAAFAFRGDAGQYLSSLVRVEAGADLRTTTGGRILVFAPRVENAGSIHTPEGQAILAAGSKIYLAAPQDTSLRGLLVEVDSDTGGADPTVNTVINQALGKIVAERGNITLAALAVNQSGRVSATTSVNLNGSVRLLARDTVVAVNDPGAGVVVPAATRGGTLVLGEGSLTEVLPEIADGRTILDEQTFTPSSVTLTGRTVHLRRNARVAVPGGGVAVTAQSGQEFQLPGSGPVEGVRVYFEPGAVIDVSGSENVSVPIERNVVEVELRGTELADSPLQRNGLLRGNTVRVDVRKGTPLANIDGVAGQIGRTVAERTSAGGRVTVRSEGDIVLREGATVDVSGGSIRYENGYINTTKLYSQGRFYDISEADPNRIYEGTADTFVKRYEKWGVTETFLAFSRGEFERGYVEGSNAGTAEFASQQLVLDGAVLGGTIAGPYQREASARPLSGQLVIGDRTQASASAPDFRLGDVLLQTAKDRLPEDFSFDSGALPAAFAGQTTLSIDALREGQIGRLAVYSNGRITLADELAMAAGGSLNLTGRQLAIRRSISVPSGQITLATRDNIDADVDPARHVLEIASGVTVSSRGLWVNDSPLLNPVSPDGPALIDGGVVSISSAADLVLGSASVVDVSGGGWLKSDGGLAAGDAGSISLKTGRVGLSQGEAQQSRLLLGGELRGFAAGRGGKLSVETTSVRIGGSADVPAQLALDSGFFGRGGFGEYVITGQDGVIVGAGTRVSATVQSLVLDESFTARATGSDIFAFSRIESLPPHQRDSVALTLNAAGSGFGNLLVEEGARLAVDPGGSIRLQAGRQLTMLGAAVARGGDIRLALSEPGDTDAFEPGTSLWLGANSNLDASGAYIPAPHDYGWRIGEVLDGGSIALDAGKGYLVAQAGAMLDVSGSSAVLDLLQGSAGSPNIQPVAVNSHAGSIDLRAREGILFDGTLRGFNGGGQARGGNLSAEITLTGSNPFFPSGDRVLTLRESGMALPAGLHPGDAIDSAAYNGRGFVSAAAVRDGGFDSLSLSARDRIELEGTVDLALRSTIQLDAPVIAAAGVANVKFDAAYVALGNSDISQQVQKAASDGDGLLALSGNLVELIGRAALRGFGDTRISSDGDLRLRGVLNGTNGRELVGALATGGDLHVKARQVYATTLSDFKLAVSENPDGRIVFERNGTDVPVLSAASRLTVEAPVIEQGGVLKAPMGEIVLDASQQLTLAAGSKTSVSADGQRIPFGRTELSGRDYAYVLDSASTLIFDAPPEKRVSLSAPEVTVAAGATVDLSGGGDLYAYEFIAGPGGSRDVLDPANASGTFAIVPMLGAGYAPYDHQYYRGVEGVQVGDVVYLSGIAGLAAGYYTLMPARYALLPGAWLVTPREGYADLLPGQTAPRIDGSQVVAGRRVNFARDGSILRDSRSSGFDVRPGAVARAQSEYLNTLASAHFTAGGIRLPADAGRLAVSAASALALHGNFLTGKAAGGRGAAVDIDAPRLAVLGSGGAGDPGSGYLRLEAESLSGLNAESLLLGGTRRSGADGETLLSVGAEEVLIANGVLLRGPELIIAARDRITVNAGAVIDGSGSLTGDPGSIRIGDAAQAGSGDGALLRVSAGGQSAVLRDGVSRARGTLKVEEGALVRADRSVALDATFDNLFSGALALGDDGALALGASRIGIGEVPSGTAGLTFSNDDIAALATLSELLLRSYSTVDLYGNASLGSATLDSLAIEAAGLAGYGNSGLTASVSAQSVELSNPNGLAFATAPGFDPGDGSLQIAAGRLVLARGTESTGFALNGFSAVQASASGEIVMQGTGSLSTPGDLTLSAQRMTAATGARYAINAGGELRTLAATGAPPAVAADGLGARLTLSAARITHGGHIELPAGMVTLRATGATADDDVLLQEGSRIVAAGVERRFADTVVAASAGSVNLESQAGDVLADAGSLIDLGASGGGDAGTLAITAVLGTVQLDATVNSVAQGSGTAAPKQGSFMLDVGTLGSFSALNARLNQGGFSETRDLRVRSGDLVVAGANLFTQRPADRVVAHNVKLAADDGDLLVGGIIDASGAKGGSIVLAANRGAPDSPGAGNVVLLSGAMLDASSTADPATVADATGRVYGTRGQGGSVLLSSGGTGVAGDVGIDVRAGSTMDISGAGMAANGGVILRAPRIGDAEVLAGPLEGTIVANAAAAAPVVSVEAVRIYDNIGNVGLASGAGRLAFSQVATDNAAFMANAAAINARLGNGARVRTGVEVRNAGDISLDADWNLYNASRPGGEPGMLTLRAGGNLLLNGSLSDGFSTAATTATLQAGESWSYRLAGGADLSAADPLAVQRAATTTGDVVLGAGRLVRTGTGTIDVAAGRDIVLTNQGSVIYTAGAPGGPLANFNNISIGGAGAEFPQGGGDLSMHAGRDIASLTGSTQLINNWLFRQGKVAEALNTTQLRNVAWWTRFREFQQGVGTLGGGDVRIVAGGDIDNLSVSIPTNGRLPQRFRESPDAAQLVVQGGGDLDMAAGGDIGSAVIYVDRGSAHVRAGGDLGSSRSVVVSGTRRPAYSVLALGDARIAIEAAGSVSVDTLVNPTLLSQASLNKSDFNRISFYSTYSGQSAASLVSQAGDMTLTNDVAKVVATYGSLLATAGSGESDALVMYPGTLRAASLAGDLVVANGFQMFPSATGNLELLADGSVSVSYNGDLIAMSDVNPGSLPSPLHPAGSFVSTFGARLGNPTAGGFLAHSDPVLHKDDDEPVRIVARTGDITGPIDLEDGAFAFGVYPKRVILEAGRDVRNAWIFGQNLDASDVTSVSAGRDIVFDTLRDISGNQRSNSGRIEVGGPGRVDVIAGRNVDLGNSSGIVTRGNLNNPYLPEIGAGVLVRAGAREGDYSGFIDTYILAFAPNGHDYGAELAAYMQSLTGDEFLSPEQARTAYAELSPVQRTGFANLVFYAELREAGRFASRTAGGLERYARGFDAIAKLFPAERDGQPVSHAGDVNLFFSQIKTEQGGDIDIMAPGGLVNAGLANPGGLGKSASQLGIVTARGGSIRSFVKGDFLVNQSRVFTLQGGDILLWSSEGNIDAGKGAKTARATPPPQLIIRGEQFILDTTNSVAGSGIAVLLAKEGVQPGDVDLIAPRGEVNAGDAGIRAAGNINIAAVRVVGADNISVGGISTGVPAASAGSIAAGLTGVSNLAADATKSAEQATRALAETAARASALQQAFRPSFITVEVLGFGDS